MRAFHFLFCLLFVVFPLTVLAQVEPTAPAEAGGVLPWILEHAPVLLELVGAAVLLASLVARLTPTSKDDEIVGWVKKTLDYFSLGGLNRGASKAVDTAS